MSRLVTLSKPSNPLEIDEDVVRAIMLANAEFACDGERGRVQGDLVFEEVTEGRQRPRGYSGCGDLIHWCLRRAGLRDESILNRDDDGGSRPWKMVVNISRLVFQTKGAFKWWKPGAALAKPGDMGLIGENGQEHVFIVSSVSDKTLRSYDYGQFFRGKHGGRAITRTLSTQRKGLYASGSQPPGRRWVGHLDVYALLSAYAARGELALAEVPDNFIAPCPSRSQA